MLSPNARTGRSDDSPDRMQTHETKRKRTALSCYECRRRKLRCDREYPSCNRCRKTGQEKSCSYDERSLQLKSAESKAPTSVQQHAGGPQDLSNWPSSISASNDRQTYGADDRPYTVAGSQPSGIWSHLGFKTREQRPAIKADNEDVMIFPNEAPPTESIIFRGGSFRTQYYGSSNPTSLVAHFPELPSFMKDSIMHHTSLPRVQRDMKTLQIRWKRDKASVLPSTDMELLQLLPDRDTVEHSVRLYFDTFETMYRILHRPSFDIEYQLFWEDRRVASPSFVVLMFLIMAAVSCLSTKEQPTYIGDSSVARERAIMWIEVSEWWLDRQSQKNIYLAMWQIRCLLILAKQTNVVKKKRTWTIAGTLIREAMSAGFHRDPSILGEKISVYEKEMRRRLWSTMTELELQASIDRGMPSASAGIVFDSAAVLNIDDKDLLVERNDCPTSKPWSDFTSCSFLHISRTSFPLRVSLNSLGNELSLNTRYEEVLNYEEMITKHLKELPPKSTGGVNQNDREMPPMVRTLLEVQLQQFLILLHAPFARQANTNSRYSLSRMICLNAAASIIEQFSQLTASSNFLLLLLRHDYFRGALIMCHTIYISVSIKNDLFLNSNSNTFIGYMEGAVSMLENRITRLGTGYTHYWYISAACSLLRSALQPEESTAQKQHAIDQVARQYYRVLASQESSFKVNEKFMPNRNIEVNAGPSQQQASSDMVSTDGMSFLAASVPQATFNQEDLPLEEFYFGDPAAWTFDNLWALE